MSIDFPTGQATLIFTDIQNSTQMWEQMGDEFVKWLDLHNQLFRDFIDLHQGCEVKTEGDAFMIAFSDVSRAIKFALDVQEGLTTIEWPESIGEILVRMGIHTGYPICTPDPATGRMDYFGPMVNRAARVAGAAHGGQILISLATFQGGEEALKLADITELGSHRLKGLEQPESLWQLVPKQLKSRTFPPLKTLSVLPTNIPILPTSFIGRTKELAELSTLLTANKLITLTGPGGTGKSRLAQQLGNDVLEHYPGGCWFVDLSDVNNADRISKAVAHALALSLTGSDTLENIVVKLLQFHKPLLLIMDNFEQIVPFANQTIGHWLKNLPNITFFVTSRFSLGLSGEQEYELLPLPTPKKGTGDLLLPNQISSFDAVRLFIERAREVKSGFDLTSDNASAIAEICATLEGMPLAIELAAARIKIMKPQQIVKKLAKKFKLLRTSNQDISSRQQTLENAIEWSYQLLSEWEQETFMQACSFHEGFTLEAAESIIDIDDIEDAPLVMDAIQELCEKSFIRTRESAGGIRYGLYVSLREFGLDRLKKKYDDEALDELNTRFSQYYLDYALEWGKKPLLESLDHIELELSNILASQEWLLENDRPVEGTEIIVSISKILDIRAHPRKRINWLTRALEQLPENETKLKALLLRDLSLVESRLTHWEQSLAYINEGIELAEKLQDPACSVKVYAQKGKLAHLTGDLNEAAKCFEISYSYAGKMNDLQHMATCLGNIGITHYEKGEYETSLKYYIESSKMLKKLNDQKAYAIMLSKPGSILNKKSIRKRLTTIVKLRC